MLVEDINTGYDFQDIFDEVQSQLGFSFVSVGEYDGYFLISGKIKFYIKFNPDEEIVMEIRLPKKDIDISDSDATIERYSSSFEAISQIRALIVDMIGGEVEDDNL